MEKTHIIKHLHKSDNCKMYVITKIHSGETEIVVSYTLSQRFSVRNIGKAERIVKRLKEDGHKYSLDGIVDQLKINKEKKEKPRATTVKGAMEESMAESVLLITDLNTKNK